MHIPLTKEDLPLPIMVKVSLGLQYICQDERLTYHAAYLLGHALSLIKQNWL